MWFSLNAQHFRDEVHHALLLTALSKIGAPLVVLQSFSRLSLPSQSWCTGSTQQSGCGVFLVLVSIDSLLVCGAVNLELLLKLLVLAFSCGIVHVDTHLHLRVFWVKIDLFEGFQGIGDVFSPLVHCSLLMQLIRWFWTVACPITN